MTPIPTQAFILHLKGLLLPDGMATQVSDAWFMFVLGALACLAACLAAAHMWRFLGPVSAVWPAARICPASAGGTDKKTDAPNSPVPAPGRKTPNFPSRKMPGRVQFQSTSSPTRSSNTGATAATSTTDVDAAMARYAALTTPVDEASTFIAMVIDRSGSMQSMGNEVAGGINLFLDEQRKDDASTGNKTTLLFSTFDTIYEKLHDGVDLPSVGSITDADVRPRGSTALHDSMAFILKDTAEAVARLPTRPGKVIVYVLTDGQENGSRVYTAAQVRAFIATLKAEHAWEFIFAAANQDALVTGHQSFGLAQADCLTYSAQPEGQRMQFASISSAVSRSKRGMSKAFSPAERNQCTM